MKKEELKLYQKYKFKNESIELIYIGKDIHTSFYIFIYKREYSVVTKQFINNLKFNFNQVVKTLDIELDKNGNIKDYYWILFYESELQDLKPISEQDFEPILNENWVLCNDELASNPQNVKEWRTIFGNHMHFVAYDKGHEYPIIGRFETQDVACYKFDEVQCLIEIKKVFITINSNDLFSGAYHETLDEALKYKSEECTHILQITSDGANIETEVVWEKSKLF